MKRFMVNDEGFDLKVLLINDSHFFLGSYRSGFIGLKTNIISFINVLPIRFKF